MECSVLFLILFFLILIIFLSLCNETKQLDDQENQQIEKYKLPPLNYFTLDEPDYFFYDPVIVKSFENGKPTTSKLQDGYLFGENNYLRYYPPKPKVIPGN
jgi:hypothetical protein